MKAGADQPLSLLLRQASRGDQRAAAELLPLVYSELRALARKKLAQTPPGQTLQPTALVHEAYLRALGGEDPGWEGRRHFFFAVSRAMRDILVEDARRKAALKRGGRRKRVCAENLAIATAAPVDDLLALDEALGRLEQRDPRKHRIVLLRFFAGLTAEETARVMDVSVRTAEREWRYVRAWLHKELTGDGEGETVHG